MKTQQHYPLKISTLAPVHIGCDETYDPSNYVIHEQTLFEFDPYIALEALSPVQRRQLNQLVSGKADETMIKALQGFFYRNKNTLMALSAHFLPVATGVANMYESRVGKIAQHESGGKKVINKLEIERTFYNPVSHRPILSGSSIKGAIRTALLNQINQGKPLQKNHKGYQERNNELQQRLFQYNMREISKDPMRLVSISDAQWTETQHRYSSEVRFAVNRQKKIQHKNGRLVQSQAEQKGLFQQLECVSGMLAHAFSTQINLQNINTIQPNKQQVAKKLQWKIEDIFSACNDFYLPQLQQEIKLLKSLNYADPEWLQQLEQLLQGELVQRLNKQQAMILRLGRHSGATAMTLDGVRSIKIMQGRGDKPRFEKEAKTLWLAASDTKSQQLTSFGWVVVELANNTPLWQDNKSSQTWHQNIVKMQQQQREKLEEEQQQQEAKAQQEKQQQAQQQAEQAAREAKLATLSPLERELEEIIEQDKTTTPAMTLFNKLNNGAWESKDEQVIVAEKIKQLWADEKKWIPEFAGKNRQKVKQKGRCAKLQSYFD